MIKSSIWSYVIVGFVGLCIVIGLIVLWRNHNPFVWPKVYCDIDITGCRNVDYYKKMYDYVSTEGNALEVIKDIFDETLLEWEIDCRRYIESRKFWKSYRKRQYDGMHNRVIISSYEMFEFRFYRTHTRYKQIDYKKYSYSVKDLDECLCLSLSEVKSAMCQFCKNIDTDDFSLEDLRDSPNKVKRKRKVTLAQRQRILRRDNFTCQICGAKSPMLGGNAQLEVDYKKPVSQGGSDSDYNLWTLCWNCNRGKSDRYDDSD